MSDYLVGIDIGTTGAKAMVMDTEGNVLSSGYREYPCIYPKQDWVEQDALHTLSEESQNDLLKIWKNTYNTGFVDFSQDEANQQHRDWQFILQEQDATALLQFACDHYSYALYQPIFEFLRVE